MVWNIGVYLKEYKSSCNGDNLATETNFENLKSSIMKTKLNLRLKIKRYSYVFLPTILILFTSCDRWCEFTYKVKNQASVPIKVISTNRGKTEIFIIDTNRETIIAKNLGPMTWVTNAKETGDSLRSFSKIDIFRDDTLKSQTDFLKTNLWVFKEISHFYADYTTTVKDTDF